MCAYIFHPFPGLHPQKASKKKKKSEGQVAIQNCEFYDHSVLSLFPKKSFRQIRVDKDTRVKKDSFLLNKTFKLTAI